MDSQKPNTPANLIDEQAQKFVKDNCSNSGFVLSLLGDDAKKLREVTVAPKLDDRTPPALNRAHVLLSTASLLAFAEKYGGEHTTIFVGQERIEVCLNDDLDIGDRECAVVEIETHRVYDIWADLMNKTVAHKDFLSALRRSESHLTADSIGILAHATRLGYAAEMDAEIVDDTNEAGFALKVKVRGNEKMETLPKSFRVRIPVWKQDADEQVYTVTINLRPAMPKNGQGPFGIELWSEEFDALLDKRLEQERGFIAAYFTEQEKPFLVLAGRAKYAKPRVGYFD